MVIQFAFDEFMDRHGNIDENNLAQSVADGFSVPVIEAVEAELQAEKDNPLKRFGAGQLWVLHETIPVLDGNGKGTVAFEEKDQVGILGQTWYDMDALKNTFTARATWTLLRSGEIKKEAMNRLDPPPFLQAE